MARDLTGKTMTDSPESMLTSRQTDKSLSAQRTRAQVFTVDPLTDRRWEEFVDRHPRSSMFHSVAWLKALQQTYGYRPVVYTTTPAGQPIKNGMVFCDVNSWLTGERLVSLPFSDHCDPLIDTQEEYRAIVLELRKWISESSHQYFELRPIETLQPLAELIYVNETYGFHRLDLRPDLEMIFKAFHKDGNEQLDSFYKLMVITRRRHRVPPQPKQWFQTLIDCFGKSLTVRMAFHEGKPIAGMLTVRHKEFFVYKYGCSDVRYNNLGGIHLLYWTSIQQAKALGCQVFDFGRCDSDQEGLMTFKRRWGATQSILQYHRYAVHGRGGLTFQPASSSWRMRLAEMVFANSPAPLLSLMGRFLKKHVG